MLPCPAVTPPIRAVYLLAAKTAPETLAHPKFFTSDKSPTVSILDALDSLFEAGDIRFSVAGDFGRGGFAGAALAGSYFAFPGIG